METDFGIFLYSILYQTEINNNIISLHIITNEMLKLKSSGLLKTTKPDNWYNDLIAFCVSLGFGKLFLQGGLPPSAPDAGLTAMVDLTNNICALQHKLDTAQVTRQIIVKHKMFLETSQENILATHNMFAFVNSNLDMLSERDINNLKTLITDIQKMETFIKESDQYIETLTKRLMTLEHEKYNQFLKNQATLQKYLLKDFEIWPKNYKLNFAVAVLASSLMFFVLLISSKARFSETI